MMINPGPSDASAIFALLTAISTPETAKASLQEILTATQDYQTLIETTQEDLKKTKDDLDTQKADVEGKLSTLAQQQSDFDSSYKIKSDELKALESELFDLGNEINANKQEQIKWNSDLNNREKLVSDKEALLSSREATTNQMFTDAKAMKDEYSSKLAALRSIT